MISARIEVEDDLITLREVASVREAERMAAIVLESLGIDVNPLDLPLPCFDVREMGRRSAEMRRTLKCS